MKNAPFVALFCFLVAVCPPVNAQTLINGFETQAEVATVQTYESQVALSTTGITQGSHSLQATFLPNAFPKITVPAPVSGPWNWSATAGLAADITNPNDVPVQVVFRVEDEQNLSSSATTDFRSAHCTIEPHETESFILPFVDSLAPSQYGVGDMPYTGIFTAQGVIGNNPFDPTHIYDYIVGITNCASVTSLYVDNVRTIAPVTFTSISDQYGQYTRTTWTGKITSQTDLTNALTNEEADLAANPGPAGRDAYGGWAGGPMLSHTGWFRTGTNSGRYWLVTPIGSLYFDFGVDGVGFSDPTFTTDRSTWLKWLPLTTDPTFGQFYSTFSGATGGPITSGTTYDFQGTNLRRKYGSAFYSQSVTMALTRLKSWGFNSIGNSSNNGLYGQGTPYQVRIDIPGTYDTVPSGASEGIPVPDPYDPNFDTALVSAIAANIVNVKSDPYLIGYYVQNEPSWEGNGVLAPYGLGLGVLGLNSTASPAKQTFLTQLQTEYSTIAAFNTAWGTTFAAWSDLDAPITIPSAVSSSPSLSSQAEADINTFITNLADTYFNLVNTEVKKQDPNHLYLGCKFSSNYWTTPVLQACAKYADVVSMDIYEPRLNLKEWSVVNSLGKPFIVAEFDNGATDMGVFSPGLVAESSEAARESAFEDYVYSALSYTAIVGVNWFQYVDQPITGRPVNGQNGCIGFLAITDSPYASLVAAARAVAPNIYTFRTSSTQIVVNSPSATTTNTASLTATLTTVGSRAAIASEPISFDIGGVTIGSATTNSSGVATLVYTVPATDLVGPYLVGANFAGTSTYGYSDGLGQLTVLISPTKITVPTVSGQASTAVMLSATLTRSDTLAAVPNETLVFSINGTQVGKAVTNSSGVATLSYTIPSGTATGSETISVTFAGDAGNSASSGSGTLLVGVAPTGITVPTVSGAAGASVVLTATLTRTDTNAPLQGYTVSFYLNGTLLGTETTHSTGIAYQGYTIPTGASAGNETIKVTFAGNSSYAASSGTGTLTVLLLPTAISVAPVSGAAGTAIVIDATLTRTDTGAGLPNRTLTFAVNGVTIGSETTHSTGIAYQGYTIPAGTTNGSLPVTVTFAGDASDTGSTGTGTITVP